MVYISNLEIWNHGKKKKGEQFHCQLLKESPVLYSNIVFKIHYVISLFQVISLKRVLHYHGKCCEYTLHRFQKTIEIALFSLLGTVSKAHVFL